MRAHGKGEAVCKVGWWECSAHRGAGRGTERVCLPGTCVVFTLVRLVLPACVSTCAEGPCLLEVVCLVGVHS